MMDPETDYCNLAETMMPSTFEEYAKKKDWYDYMRNYDLLLFLDEALDDQKRIKDDVEDIRKQNNSMALKSGLVGLGLGIGLTLGIRKLYKVYKKRRASRGK